MHSWRAIDFEQALKVNLSIPGLRVDFALQLDDVYDDAEDTLIDEVDSEEDSEEDWTANDYGDDYGGSDDDESSD